MNFNGRRIFLAGVLAALPAATAFAATPESGTISASSPKVEWTGSTVGSYTVLNPMANAPEDVPCEAPTCDTFALKVEGGGVDMEVMVGEAAPEADAVYGMRVVDPSGTITYFGSEPGSPAKLKFKKAAAGDWSIGMVNNSLATSEFPGQAALLVAAPAAPAPTGPAPAPGSPAPQQQQQTAPQAVQVTLKAPKKASAKKLAKAKKLAVGVTVSREVESVTAELKKGSKVVGRGKLGKLAGTGKVALKVRKLKRGAYTISVTVKTADGVSAVKTAKLKVSR